MGLALLRVKPIRGQPQAASNGQERPNPENLTHPAMPHPSQAQQQPYHDKKRGYDEPDHPPCLVGHWPTTAPEIGARGFACLLLTNNFDLWLEQHSHGQALRVFLGQPSGSGETRLWLESPLEPILNPAPGALTNLLRLNTKQRCHCRFSDMGHPSSLTGPTVL